MVWRRSVGAERPTQTTRFSHVTNRGNARGEIFSDERDYVKFLKWLTEVVPRFGWRCHSYCLIPNHYHLLLETPELNLGDGMLVLNGSYARWFNYRHDRVGHVFQGPYRPEPVEDEPHFLERCRYIALNPVRAGLCTDPADWRSSSYRALAGLEHHPPYLDRRPRAEHARLGRGLRRLRGLSMQPGRMTQTIRVAERAAATYA